MQQVFLMIAFEKLENLEWKLGKLAERLSRIVV